ncbi:MAG: LysM peptidoglycan-binding domain-containing protein [Anaerolineae bacterium]|nr:LysM peptidoglycan-binding domain-containing protein [Anaerolineae bacterium]
MSPARKSRSPRRSYPKIPRERLIPLALLLILLVVFAFNWLRARNTEVPMTARLTVLQGQVSIRRADAGTDPPLGPGGADVLQRGDRVQTGPGARARITFSGEDTAELIDDTELAILDLHKRPITRAQVIRLLLDKGSVWVRTSASLLPGRQLEIETQVATVQAQSGQLACTVVDAQRVQVAVQEGAATVSMEAQSLELSAGQSVEATLGRPLALTAAQWPSPGASLAPLETPLQRTGRPTLSDREKTLFPPVLTPTRPGDEMELYTVQAGDTLYGIAQRFGVPWESIWEANRTTLPSPEMLQVGQELRIPRP